MISRLLLLSLLIFNNFLCADITKFFKKAPNKGTNHSMKGIDFIYTLNLDQRPEKFASCTSQLSVYDIHPYRFSAVNGWELTLEDINTLGVIYDHSMRQNLWGTSYLLDGGGQPHHEVMQTVGRNYFCHCMARGPIGIVLSHLSILNDAYTSGYERIWVMEDDIQVIKNPHTISKAVEKLDKLVGKDGWDMLFTDKDTKDRNGNYVPCYGHAYRPNFTPKDAGRFARRTIINQDFIKIGARYGAYSVIVQKSGMKKILDFIIQHKIFLPYDMEFYLPNDMRIYTVTNDIVSTQPQALSDNGAPNYLDAKRTLEIKK